MIDTKDLGLPAAVAAGLALAAAGVGAAVAVARNPERMRELMRVAAGGVERVGVALAETREELADLWAELRDQARRDAEDAAFAAPQAAGASPSAGTPPREPARKRSTGKSAKQAAPGRKTAKRAPAKRSRAARSA